MRRQLSWMPVCCLLLGLFSNVCERVWGQQTQPDAGKAVGEKVVGEPFVYKQVTDKQKMRSLQIFVTKPDDWQSSDHRPAIVFFHGGGWVGGAPGQFTEHAKYFASRGLVCFQVEYRLLDRQTNEPPITCTQDAVDAMRWVRKRCQELGVDCNRIAAAGGSAGGHTAAYLGCVDQDNAGAEANGQGKALDESDQNGQQQNSKPDALILFNPVYDNGPGGWGTARVGERYLEFSPLHNLSQDDPPSIVFFGSNDKLVPVATAEKFRDRCIELGSQQRTACLSRPASWILQLWKVGRNLLLPDRDGRGRVSARDWVGCRELRQWWHHHRHRRKR